MDCPICYELVPTHNNCVTTECGHTFHTNCLLKHTVYNGYNCPFCRTSMSTSKPDDEDVISAVSEYSVEERMTRDDDDYYEEDDGSEEEAGEAIYPADDDDLYVLDAFRWLWQRAEGQSIDHYDDPFSAAFERWRIQMDINCKEFDTQMNRKSDLILEQLEKIKAFTYEDLLKGYLFCTDGYFGGSVKFAAYDRKVTSTLNSVLKKIDTSSP